MRKLCPNFDREDGLDTVLEVPIPEEMFANMGNNATLRWQNMRSWMREQRAVDALSNNSNGFHINNNGNGGSNSSNHEQFMLFLKLIGAPLIPFQVQAGHTMTLPINDGSIEASTAKYIVQQYLAAIGGVGVLDSVSSMYAVGQVKTIFSDIHQQSGGRHGHGHGHDNDQQIVVKRNSEIGGFVIWQKNPDLWFLELVVSGCKISAGSNGKVAWNQSSSHPSQSSKGQPRPLRRFFQGLDPRSTANLFINAVCIGEKTLNNEDCFLLKLDTSTEILKMQSTPNTEIVHHTIWGYFSQRTGLLMRFDDSKLVRMKSKHRDECIFWETSMESVLEDYRYVEGINIAHGGKTSATIYRYGKSLNHKARIEETWRIEEIDFNICGLSLDCFLAPSDDYHAKKEQETYQDHPMS